VQGARTDTQTQTEDLGFVLKFRIPILSRQPVTPPGETESSSC
jgi:hypothetical protein